MAILFNIVCQAIPVIKLTDRSNRKLQFFFSVVCQAISSGELGMGVALVCK